MAKSKKKAIPAKRGTKRGRTVPQRNTKEPAKKEEPAPAANPEPSQPAPETPPPWASQ